MEFLIAGVVTFVVLLLYRGIITAIVAVTVLVAGGGFWGALLAGLFTYTLITLVRRALMKYVRDVLQPDQKTK